MKFDEIIEIVYESNQIDIENLAKRAGYSSSGFHGTTERWTVYNFGNRATTAPDEAIYVTDSKEEAIIAASPSRSRAIVMELFIKTDNPLIIDAKGTKKERSFGNIGYKRAIEIAKSKGHDSIIVKNIIDYGDDPQTTTILFDPTQIKLTDPITYDDNGKIIPLSKRFDSNNPDIRY